MSLLKVQTSLSTTADMKYHHYRRADAQHQSNISISFWLTSIAIVQLSQGIFSDFKNETLEILFGFKLNTHLASFPSLYVRPQGCLCFCSGQTSGNQRVKDPSIISPTAHAGSLSRQ